MSIYIFHIIDEYLYQLLLLSANHINYQNEIWPFQIKSINLLRYKLSTFKSAQTIQNHFKKKIEKKSDHFMHKSHGRKTSRINELRSLGNGTA